MVILQIEHAVPNFDAFLPPYARSGSVPLQFRQAQPLALSNRLYQLSTRSSRSR
jgi:hypothetical protein